MKYIEVDLFDWGKASSPDILFTESLGPCSGLAIYNPQEKIGYVAHWLGGYSGLLDEVLEAVLQEADPSVLEATVAGTSLGIPRYDTGKGYAPNKREWQQMVQQEHEFNDQIRGYREQILSKLSTKGITKVTNKFSKRHESSSSIYLYTKNGKVEVTEKDSFENI